MTITYKFEAFDFILSSLKLEVGRSRPWWLLEEVASTLLLLVCKIPKHKRLWLHLLRKYFLK